VVLGAAAGGGFPQWNSNNEACQRARAGDPKARPCTQSSLAVTGDDTHWFLLNASPDLRQQINENPSLHPHHGVRHSPIAGVVLTNGDVDHIAGLLTLRESQPLVIYATNRVLSVLRENSIFGVLNPSFVERRAMPPDEPFELETKEGAATGVVVEAFAVPGKVALYKEDAAAGSSFGTVAEDTVGLRVAMRDGDAHFFYIPGCAALTSALKDRLRNAPLVLFDGTLWRDDEMIVQEAGKKTGARMGHMSVSGPSGSLAGFEALGVRRRIFIHMNNTNPILLADSPERAAVGAAGWEVAFDGMEIVV
jgi:pyrroloquinoline quinone biosynthesis protein B